MKDVVEDSSKERENNTLCSAMLRASSHDAVMEEQYHRLGRGVGDLYSCLLENLRPHEDGWERLGCVRRGCASRLPCAWSRPLASCGSGNLPTGPPVPDPAIIKTKGTRDRSPESRDGQRLWSHIRKHGRSASRTRGGTVQDTGSPTFQRLNFALCAYETPLKPEIPGCTQRPPPGVFASKEESSRALIS